jgi:hypothetical protein
VRQFRRGSLSFFCHTCWADYPMLQSYLRPFIQKDKAVKPLAAVSSMPKQKQASSQKREILAFPDTRNNARKNSLSNHLSAS